MKNAIVDILMSRLLLAAAQNYLFATIFFLILTSSLLFVVVMFLSCLYLAEIPNVFFEFIPC